MGLIHSLIRSVVPGRLARAMEEESRRWVVRCPCGSETSVWEMGGVRYLASGNPRRMVRCGSCGTVFLGRLEKKDKPATDTGLGLD